ncbi:MAG: short chain dehydrogenase [Acidobacteria bacterium]|nr:MAG: short chain dehydrogenase [Acidobacteriota bacterium]
MSHRDLQNRVLIITGASAGIGRETALLFARERCRLVLAARRQDRLESLLAEIKSLGGEAVSLPIDVSDQDQVEHLVRATAERFGRLDILVNNAGYGLFATVEDTTVGELQSIFATNFAGPFYAIKAALPIMRRQRYGHIINVSSIAGKRAFPFSGAYCATKFAMNGLTESLRTELMGSGIDVSLVLPIGTNTEFFAVAKNKSARPAKPLGIVQSAQQVAEAIVKCAKNPKAEVLPYPPSRVLILLNSISPRLVDWVGAKLVHRSQRK